jgi:hypothetical protein
MKKMDEISFMATLMVRCSVRVHCPSLRDVLTSTKIYTYWDARRVHDDEQWADAFNEMHEK